MNSIGREGLPYIGQLVELEVLHLEDGKYVPSLKITTTKTADYSSLADEPSAGKEVEA